MFGACLLGLSLTVAWMELAVSSSHCAPLFEIDVVITSQIIADMVKIVGRELITTAFRAVLWYTDVGKDSCASPACIFLRPLFYLWDTITDKSR